MSAAMLFGCEHKLPSRRGGLAVCGGPCLGSALRLGAPTSNRIDRYDCDYKQHSNHNHWNADEIQRCGCDRATKEAWTGTCFQASAATKPAAICLSWGSPAAIIKHRPVTKRPNAIHLGNMANLIVAPTTCRHCILRRGLAGGNEVVWRCNRGPLTARLRAGLLFTPAAAPFGSGGAARSLSDKHCGRPPINPELAQRIRKALAVSEGPAFG